MMDEIASVHSSQSGNSQPSAVEVDNEVRLGTLLVTLHMEHYRCYTQIPNLLMYLSYQLLNPALVKRRP